MRPSKPRPTTLWVDEVAPRSEGFNVIRKDEIPDTFLVSRAMFQQTLYHVRLIRTTNDSMRRVVAEIFINTSDISSQDDLNAAGEALLNLYRLTHCKSE